MMTPEIQAKIDAVKAPFTAMLAAADEIPALVDAAEKAKYDEGFAAGEVAGMEKGKAMIQLPDAEAPEAIYTQAQMNEAVSAGKAQQVAEDQIKINELVAKVADLEGQLAAVPPVAEAAPVVDVDAAVKAALATQKAEFVAKLKAVKADDEALLAELDAVAVDPAPTEPQPVEPKPEQI